MTHEQILEQSRKDLKAIYKQAKEKLKAIEPREAEVGKWYKDPNSQYLVHVTKVLGKHNYVEVYGFDCKGIWFDKWDTVVHQLCTEATPQEVEKALIEEAKRRYKIGDKLNKVKEDCADDNRFFESHSFSLENNCLYFNSTNRSFYSYCIFDNGQWATIIEQDKFAELKEAHRNGAVIQMRNKSTFNQWKTLEFNPSWNPNNEYRIKPEEKPKAGDVCKFWDTCEDHYFIAKLHSISEGEFPYTVYQGYSDFMNAKTLTKQEAIELLYGKDLSCPQ